MANANSDGALSGTNAKAVLDNVLVLRVTQWSVNPVAGATVWGDSDSAGYTNRLRGRRDCTFSMTGKFDTNRAIYTLFAIGDNLKSILWQNASLYWAFPRSIVDSFTITFNQDTKEVVDWSADFGSDGAFYYPGQSGAPVETLPSS